MEGTIRYDIDAELMANLFNNNTPAAVQFVNQVHNQVRQVFEEDGGVSFELAVVRPWLGHDPFGTSGDSLATLIAYENYISLYPQEWSVSVLLSGAWVGGSSKGAAIQDSMCDTGVAVVFVPWLSGFAQYRAIDLTIHEMGHTLDMDHTHCQATPLDQCWSGGGFLGAFGAPCYTGPLSCPTGGGTVMSICYDGGCSPQLNSISFHPNQRSQLNVLAQGKTCLRSLLKDGFE